ncbi:ATP-dependent helicase [Patescibacteria group bacterium]
MEQQLLEKLNEEQLKAVTHKEGPLLIVAGAGTGKTTVITQRIAYMIEQGVASSDEILALTFTEKAAGEMEERVDRLLPMGYLDLWISTFHSFGERIMKDHGLDIGLSNDFKLLNEFEQWALVRKNLDKFDLDYYRPMGNPTKFIQALLRHFSRAKDEDISPAQYLAYSEELKENMDSMLGGAKKKKITNYKLQITNFDGEVTQEMAEQEVNRINEVANAYHVYQQLLLDNNALDFGDLINYSLKLFRERPRVLKKYQNQFKFIMLDEFQDTNWAQYELVKMIATPKNPQKGRTSNLAVVGDDDQSIYAFRGASMSNILQFKKDYPRAQEIVLTKNYRNKQNILDLSYNFIQLNNPNRLEYQLSRQSKLDKKLVAQEKSKGVIGVLHEKNFQDENKAIVEKIADLKIKDKRASWNDFAILVRANESAKEICAVLDLAGLPYQYLASRGLYSKPIILDVVAYLRALDDYHDSTAVYRILNLPHFDFTDQELISFNFIAKKKTWSLFTVLKDAQGKLGAETQKKINQILGLIDKHTALARHQTVSEAIIAFLNDSGYLKYLTETDEARVRETLAYLNKFMKRVKKFEADHDNRGVKEFLSELNMEIESGEEGAISPDMEAGPEAIKLMTVHGAKGLEFKYVFIANMVDKRFPTTGRRETILIPDALVKEILPEGDIHLEEERRLFYVAMTRAKHGLYFSWARDYGGARVKKPSRFLVETELVSEQAEAEKDKTKKDQELKDLKPQEKKSSAATSQLSMPSYFSYTQLAAFGNCPYQYYFAHIIKVPRRSKFTFSFGQTMHLALQRIFQKTQEKKGLGQESLFSPSTSSGQVEKKKTKKANITWEEIREIYESAWIDEWYDSKQQKEEYRKLGQESLKNYYEKYKDNWPQAVSLEQGINLKISGYRIFGKIDRIDELKQGKVQIVDYKTGTPKDPDKISPEDKEQLLIYQLAAEQALNKKIDNLQFYYLNNNSEINFVGSEEELRGMEEKILDSIKKIETAIQDNNFAPKPGPLCKYCDFFSICKFRKM